MMDNRIAVLNQGRAMCCHAPVDLHILVSDPLRLPQHSLADISGQETPLRQFEGKVLLLVNTASKCGLTPQYKALEEVYTRYRDQGLVIIGFPANDFLGQEPGTNDQIKEFCLINYGVSFPMFAKISVRGKNIHPLYKFLVEKETNPGFAGKIS
jgi:glutathione peroxidase